MGTITITLAGIGPAQRAVTGAVRHLADWLDYQTGGRSAAPPRPARITYVGGSPRNARPSQDSPPCLACGRPLGPADGALRLHGDVYHAACALYQPRGRAS